MDSRKYRKQSLAEWYAQNARTGAQGQPPELLYSRTVVETAETMTDRGYFVAFLTPEESRSGRMAVAVYEETVVYTREENGDPGEILHSETEIMYSF